MAPFHRPYFNPDGSGIFPGTKIMYHILLDCLDRQSQFDTNPP